MSKYIIRNCPSTYQSFEDKFVCTSQIKEKGFPFYCKDCTDCVLKQIVEKCKGSYKSEWAIECNNYRSGRYTMARDILNLLDIQEINE